MNLVVYDSAERPARVLEELIALFNYRDLVLELVSRNIKVRYKRSVLGIVWTMLNPLMMMVVLTFVFSSLFGMALHNYPVYLLSGLLLWVFFAQVTVASMSESVWGASLLKRIYVPRTVFVVSAVCTGTINWILALVPLMLIMFALKVPVGPALLLLPVAILLTAMFAMGVGLLISILAVYFADVAEIYQVLLTAWMYFTPIIYPIEIIPASYRWLFFLNPMFYLVEVFRTPIHLNSLPSVESFILASFAAIVTLIAGWWFFARNADELVYRA